MGYGPKRKKNARVMVDSRPLLLYKNGRLLSNKEVGKEMGVSDVTIAKWINENEMPEYAAERLKEIQKSKGVELNGST